MRLLVLRQWLTLGKKVLVLTFWDTHFGMIGTGTVAIDSS